MFCRRRQHVLVPSVQVQVNMLSYSVFEEFTKQAITPSMYQWMSERVENDMYTVEDAVDAYFNLPQDERVRLHVEMLQALEYQKEVSIFALDKIERELHEEELFFVT